VDYPQKRPGLFLLIIEAMEKLSEFKYFKSGSFHVFDQIKVFKSAVVNRALPSLPGTGSCNTFEFPSRVNFSG